MKIWDKQENRQLLKQYTVAGIVIAIVLALIEYFSRLMTNNDPQEFLPLIIRANVIGILITFSIALFDIMVQNWVRNKTFLQLLITRSLFYTLIISFWLAIVNGTWEAVDSGFSFRVGLIYYVSDEGYLINLLSVMFFLTIFLAIRQINSLHRKGELLEFMMGKYHEPKELERIFCFIDLKGSTAIGEQLGHYQFGLFLKDYYSDITDAIRKTEAEIYQYVGDEIILFWPYKKGLKNNNMIHCFFLMKEIIHQLKDKYLKKYGVFPEFKAGLHGGKVTVTWVGEIKKEIVFLGDVLNTTSRIQESCKRLSKEFLISKELLDQTKDLGNIEASFIEETVLRGKEKTVQLFSLELGSGLME